VQQFIQCQCIETKHLRNALKILTLRCTDHTIGERCRSQASEILAMRRANLVSRKPPFLCQVVQGLALRFINYSIFKRMVE